MTNNELQQLSDDFFQNSLASSPTSAIMRGYKEYFDPVSYTHLTLPTKA